MSREEELKAELAELRRVKHNEYCRIKKTEERRAAGIPIKRVGRDTVRCLELTTIRNRSVIGKLKTIYHSQLRNSRSRGHEEPQYSLEEFVAKYSVNGEYIRLHTEWADSNYDKFLAPSFDRLDDSKGYSFDNLQVVTWKRNNTKAHEDMRSNKLLNGHVAIVQYLEGKSTHYTSASEAERATGISSKAIVNATNGLTGKTRDGSVWVKSEKELEAAIVKAEKPHGLSKTVLQYTLDGEYVATHESTPKAAEAIGLKSSSNIRAVCDGRRAKAGGFVWKYE